jgi:pimeloyl-ACP methyl ester carboxylesterase
VREYTAWLVALLDELGIERAHFVGHSFGGRVGIVLANEHPERVAKLVLTDSAGIRPRRTLAYYLKVYSYKLLRVLAQRPSSTSDSSSSPPSLPLSGLIPKPVREWAAAQVAKRGSADYQQASGTVRQSLVRVVNEDLRGLLPHIAAPTLLIWGENDADTPLSDGKMMERLIPDAGLVVFEGAGHYAYLEQPVRFCRIIETFFQS